MHRHGYHHLFFLFCKSFYFVKVISRFSYHSHVLNMYSTANLLGFFFFFFFFFDISLLC